jgi:signal transduction histidine kinase
MSAQPLFDTTKRPTGISGEVTGRDDAGATTMSTSDENGASPHLRTQFLRRVAHDIASPAGLTMTVLEELAAESSRPELVAMARRGLRRLLRLSEQLALASDAEAGALSLDVSPEDLRGIVKDALDQAVTIDGRRDIVAACQAPGERLMVDVERRLVVSSLREVIGNAIRLASSRVEIEVGSRDGHAFVRVQDDGPGFSPEALAHLGERFTPGSTTRGLGVSLSLAKDVLTAHGGGLEVASSELPPGRRGVRGAAVTVTLPLAPAAPRAGDGVR